MAVVELDQDASGESADAERLHVPASPQTARVAGHVGSRHLGANPRSERTLNITERREVVIVSTVGAVCPIEPAYPMRAACPLRRVDKRNLPGTPAAALCGQQSADVAAAPRPARRAPKGSALPIEAMASAA